MRFRFYTADVFTGCIFGGNPLAVFPQARGLRAEHMQQIAREFNLSETVFVFTPEKAEHTRRLRIFTPGVEVPFAGHPTIGAAHVLAAVGEIKLTGERTHIVFEENIGPIRVTIAAAGGQPTSAQLSATKMPEFGPKPPPAAELAAILSLKQADLAGNVFSPQALSCGVPFLFIPLQSRAALQRVHLDMRAWKQLLSSFWAPHVYCFALDPELDGSDLRARMFAPAMGIEEDPATGAAATALAGYLGTLDPTANGSPRWVVEQGFEMGRPSLLEVEADKLRDEIVAIRVGGSCVLISEGVMEIPNV